MRHITFILDRSGSMGIIRNATIDAFNEFLEKNRTKTRWTLCLFDRHEQSLTWPPYEPVREKMFNSPDVEIVYKAKKGKNVPRLNQETYRPRGLTPLYDAIGQTVSELDDANQNVVVIMTDGLENASVLWNRVAVLKLIEEKEAKNYQFIYLGANQDARLIGQDLGIMRGVTVTYDATPASVMRGVNLAAVTSTSYFDNNTVAHAHYEAGDAVNVTKETKS